MPTPKADRSALDVTEVYALCARTQLSSCGARITRAKVKTAERWAHHDHAHAGIRRCEKAIQPVRRRNRWKGGWVTGAAVLG